MSYGPERCKALVPNRVVATLDRFIKATSTVAGLSIYDMDSGARICARTLNTTYWILVCHPRRRGVVILGGRFFRVPTPALLNGSTFGGSLLKEGWIGVGMQLEVWRQGMAIVTTPVQSIVTGCIAPTSRDCERAPGGPAVRSIGPAFDDNVFGTYSDLEDGPHSFPRPPYI